MNLYDHNYINQIITFDSTKKKFLLILWTKIICNKYKFNTYESALFAFPENVFIVDVYDRYNTVHVTIPDYKVETILLKRDIQHFNNTFDLLSHFNVTEEILEKFIFTSL